MSEIEERSIMGCAVCGRVLADIASRSKDEVVGYAHVEEYLEIVPEDHVVIPVPIEELKHLRVKCDFCGVETTRELSWTVPANTFDMPTEGDKSIGDWAACEDCGRLVAKKRWGRLLDRGVQGQIAACHAIGIDPPPELMLRDYVEDVYGRLRKNITAPPRPSW